MESHEEAHELKKKTIYSTLSLFFQSGYSALLGLAANIILTVVLSPEIFGIYFITLSFIAFLNYFSDIGLAASLVQKKDITDDDVKTTFTIQQILIISLITIGYVLTPAVISFYKLPHEGQYLYWALLGSFFLSSLKTIPSIFLERQVQFQKIVFVQVVENTFFYIAVMIFGLLGFGLQSFTFSVLLRALVGVIVMYSIAFWRPLIGISYTSARELISFGAPFQASSLLALVKDEFVTLYLGKVVGLEALGYIGWAKKWAEAPIRIIMDNISRVLFPVLARVQQDKGKVSRIIEKILYYQTLLLAPTLIGMAIVMSNLVFLIPKYSKWAPALPIFYMFCFSALFSSYSTPFINLFNALGRVKISFSFMIYWTVTTWILTPIMTQLFGYYGFPLVQIFLSLTFIYIIYLAKQIADFQFFKSVYPAIVSALIMGVVVLFITQLSLSWIAVIMAGCVGGITYFLLLKLLFKINLIHEVRALLKR
jgi:O-antigen/teichoic acid export membrane protein